jgi:hypothetical protein
VKASILNRWRRKKHKVEMSITLCVWKDQRGSEKSISSKRHSLEPNRFWKTAFWNCCCWSRSEQQKQKLKLRRLWLWRQERALVNSLEFDLAKKVQENENEDFYFFSCVCFARKFDLKSDWLQKRKDKKGN